MAGPNSVNISVGIKPDPTSVNAAASMLGAAFAKQTSAGINKALIQLRFPINDRQFTGALGNMGTSVKSFDTTLAAANKRVISFGVSLGILGGSVRAFTGLISATRDLEQHLAKISGVMALTSQQTNQLSKGLFDLAKQTGSSFEDAAGAVEEFAKQGGNLVQTFERSRTALALAKVGQLDYKETVDGLITAYTNFGRVGEDYVSIANKISVANRTSTLSVKDAIQGIGAFGAEALDAGISVNKLIGILAALKQSTGDVSARNLNRVFANLQNPTTIKKLSAIPGFETTDQNGQIKESIVLLNDLAKAYQTLSTKQKDVVKQAIGGTIGGNTAQVLLNGLGNPNGISARTTDAIENSTDDLNKRLVYQVNNLDQSIKNLETSAKRAGSSIGELVFKPALNNLVGSGNLLGNLFGNIKNDGSTKPAEDFGAYLGESILKGIGNVVAGPGLIILSRLVTGVASRTFSEVTKDIKQTIGFTSSQDNDLNVLRGRNALLQLATNEERKEYEAAISVVEQHRILNNILQEELILAKELNLENAKFAQGTLGLGIRSDLSRIGRAAGGYSPAMSAERSAIVRGIGGAPSSARPVAIDNFAYGGGVAGPMVANSSEFMVNGSNGSTIYNRDMIRQFGLPPGATPISAGGYVPNAAGGGIPGIGDATLSSLRGASPLFQPLVAGQDAVEQFQKGLTGLIKKGFDLSQLDLNVPQKQLRESVRDLVASSLQISPSQFSDPKIKAALNKVTSATIEAQSNRIAYYQEVQGYRSLDSHIMNYGSRNVSPEQFAATQRARSSPGNAGPFPNLTGIPNGLSPNENFQPSGDISPGSIENQVVSRQIAQKQRLSLAQHAGNLNNALLFGSFGAGFIPNEYTKGGTTSGIVAGGIQGGLTGGAVGGQIGSIFGPEGTIIGASVGLFVGALTGASNKLRQSFDELAKSVDDVNKNNDQKINSAREYLDGLNRLKEAARGGASNSDLQRIARDNDQNFNSISSGDLKDQITATKNDPDKLAQLIISLQNTASHQSLQGNVPAFISKYVTTPNDINSITGKNENLISAANSVASLFGGQKVNDAALNQLSTRYKSPPSSTTPYSVGGALFTVPSSGEISNQEYLKPFASFLKQGGLSEESINKTIADLSSLSKAKIDEFKENVAKAISSNQKHYSTPQFSPGSIINVKAIQDAIQDDIDSIQQGININGGLASYTRRSGQQRLAAASRILSINGGRTRYGNRLTDSGGLEGELQIQQAQEVAKDSNAQAIGTARAGFLGALNTDSISTNLTPESKQQLAQLDELRKSIKSATSPDQFRKLAQDNPFLSSSDKKLGEVVKTLEKTQADNEREIQLVKEGIDLQRQELEVTKQNVLFTRGGFNLKSINEFSNLGAAASYRGIGQIGSASRLSAQLQQSELLDSLGLPKGDETADYQFKLRKRAVAEQFSVLDSRSLGRRVGTNFNSLESAALQLQKSNDPGLRELGQRQQQGLSLFGVDPKQITKSLLSGKATTDDLKTSIALGQISPGDSAIVSAIGQTNALLIDSNKNTNSIATNTPNRGGTPPAEGGAPSLPDTIDGKPVVDGITILPEYTVFGARNIASGGVSKGNISLPATDSPPASKYNPDSFSAGFFNTLSSKQADGPYQIAAQSAENLSQSFSKFFGDFTTGALKGQQAFRQFAVSVLADESRLYAENAVTSSLSAIGSLFTHTQKNAQGGFIHFANGGSVPAMLTGGEYVFNPNQARRLGPQALRSLNAGHYASGGVVTGGSGTRDDVPANLQPGSFVVKAPSVRKYGARFLNKLAGGDYVKRDVGGGIFGAGVGGDFEAGGLGALAGGLIGLLLDKNNRGQGALIGAGLGFGLGFSANALGAFGGSSPVSTPLSTSSLPTSSEPGSYAEDAPIGADSNAVTNSAAGAQSKALGDLGIKVGAAGILGGASYLLRPNPQPLGFNQTQSNALQLQANNQANVNNRPAGSFVNVVRGKDGQYNIISNTGPANEFVYGNNGGTPYGYNSGGTVGGGYTPLSDGSSNSTVTSVNPVITIHNYANGNTTSSVSNVGSPSDKNSNPLASQDFANTLNKHINAAVNEALVNSQRNGGLFNTKQRYSPNNFA